MKIDLKDFMSILKKYSLKITNFSKINEFLMSESTQVAKFFNTPESQNAMQEVRGVMEKVFGMSMVNMRYIDPQQPQNDCEETTSVCVSFGDEDIFAKAIKLSKLEIQKQQAED